LKSLETLNLDSTSGATKIAAACEIEWSPDGAILAVTESALDCTLDLDGVTFISANSEILHEHIVSSTAETADHSVPIGWIAR
jgi:hypothetical protein